MTYEEVAQLVESVEPWVCLWKNDGKISITLDGEFDLEVLKFLVEMMESVEQMK